MSVAGFVTSKDGTRLAISRLGAGPALVLVDGALCRRGFGPMVTLAPLLAKQFSVVHYDRRGRGESGDAEGYSIEREIEDLAAVVESMGEVPSLYGTSSGAMLAARAVADGVKVKRLVLHEPPLALDGTHQPEPADLQQQVARALADDRRGDAVALFMKSVGVPGIGRFMMRLIPGVWSGLTPSAHTLPYDFAMLGDTQRGVPLPRDVQAVFHAIDVPTRVLVGGKSPAWMHHAVKRVAQEIPGADVHELPGQQHNVAAKAVAPQLVSFFA